MMPKATKQIRIDGDIAYVPLTKGYEAVIDASDVQLIGGVNWYAKVALRPDGTIRTVYARRRFTDQGGKKVSAHLHRVITSAPDGMEVDHRDGNGLDNRRCNLRVTTRAENARNLRVSIANKSGVKGVYWQKARGKWEAALKLSGKTRHLGFFTTLEAAADAYAAASAEMHGNFGRLA